MPEQTPTRDVDPVGVGGIAVVTGHLPFEATGLVAGAAALPALGITRVGSPPQTAGQSVVVDPPDKSFSLIAFYGEGASSSEFAVDLIGWRQVSDGPGTSPVWIPFMLTQIEVVLGAMTSTDMVPGRTVRLADSLTVVTDATLGGVRLLPTLVGAGGLPMQAFLDHVGAQLLELRFTNTSTTAAGALVTGV